MQERKEGDYNSEIANAEAGGQYYRIGVGKRDKHKEGEQNYVKEGAN